MTPAEQESTINGAALRLARETRGWALSDMATRSCMSIRQIRQLEEGGSSSFYSVNVKLTAVKKVGSLLGLTEEQLFIAPAVAMAADTAVSMVSQAETDALNEADALNDVSFPEKSEFHADAVLNAETTAVTPQAQDHSSATATPKSKVSLWAILGLFAAALGVAAVMRPTSEPEPVATESVPPPVLVLPEAEDGLEKAKMPASGATLSAEVASAAVVPASAKIGLAGTAASAIAPKPAASATAAVASMPAAPTASQPASAKLL